MHLQIPLNCEGNLHFVFSLYSIYTFYSRYGKFSRSNERLPSRRSRGMLVSSMLYELQGLVMNIQAFKKCVVLAADINFGTVFRSIQRTVDLIGYQ